MALLPVLATIKVAQLVLIGSLALRKSRKKEDIQVWKLTQFLEESRLEKLSHTV
jgi:hypothetical protein